MKVCRDAGAVRSSVVPVMVAWPSAIPPATTACTSKRSADTAFTLTGTERYVSYAAVVLLRRRTFLGPDAYVFGVAATGENVKTFRSAWETLLLLANGVDPTREKRGQRPSNRKALAQINLHWHDLRHEALSRLADDGVPVHELQLLAGHASITTTQRYMNARANSLAESMRQARERRANRVTRSDREQVPVGCK